MRICLTLRKGYCQSAKFFIRWIWPDDSYILLAGSTSAAGCMQSMWTWSRRKCGCDCGDRGVYRRYGFFWGARFFSSNNGRRFVDDSVLSENLYQDIYDTYIGWETAAMSTRLSRNADKLSQGHITSMESLSWRWANILWRTRRRRILCAGSIETMCYFCRGVHWIVAGLGVLHQGDEEKELCDYRFCGWFSESSGDKTLRRRLLAFFMIGRGVPKDFAR